MLDRMAGAAAQMSPDMLLTLITDPPPMPSRLRRRAWTSPASCRRG